MQDPTTNRDAKKLNPILPPSKVKQSIKTANIVGSGVGLGLGLSRLVNIYRLAKG